MDNILFSRVSNPKSITQKAKGEIECSARQIAINELENFFDWFLTTDNLGRSKEEIVNIYKSLKLQETVLETPKRNKGKFKVEYGYNQFGSEEYRWFDTLEEAEEFYNSLFCSKCLWDGTIVGELIKFHKYID